MVGEERLFRAAEIHVRREVLANEDVRIRVDNADGFSSTDVSIDLRAQLDGAPRAAAAVTWTADIGPPFSGTMTHVTGYTSLSSIDWNATEPIWLNFQLHGLIDGRPSCVHGEVLVPR